MRKPVMNRDTVVAKVREHADVIRSYGVKTLAIFGSVARGQQNSRSDVDMLVEFEP
ncbi:MAG: nucleotidyltransferase domain-containing protein [Chitinophagales bacterium]|nr:nucleotidyltransferase domain-containing protein [Chitinophagales bacterium]